MRRSRWCALLFSLGAAALPALSQASGPFTFAWLSDTHVGSPTGAEDLAAAVADINSLDSIAFVVLSGDITELGSNAEIDTARSLLSGLRPPYHIIPGNHDTKWSESGCTHFPATFGSDRFLFRYGGLTFLGLHEGPMMRMGDGHFAPEDIRWTDSLLATVPRSEPLVFVTHYPLDNSLDNWYEMTDRLRARNTRMVLVGHGHTNRALEFEGLQAVMGRSNLRARQAVGGYTLVTVRDDTARFFERTHGGPTLPAWRTIVLRLLPAADLPHVNNRPEYAINGKYPDVRQAWAVRTGYTITGGPAAGGGLAYVGDRGGMLRALRCSDGREEWAVNTGHAILSTPALSASRLVTTSTDGSVNAYDAGTGETIWSHRTGAANVACPEVVDGIVYVGGGDGIFRALRLDDGSLLWSYDSVGAFVETKPLVTSTSVVFGAWDSYLYCLDRRTGELRWKWNNGTTARGLSPAAAWPVESGGRIFIAAPDRAATVLDERTGTEVWRSKAHQVREAVGRSVDGSRFYGKCMNDTLFAYDASAATERLSWFTPCGYGYDIDPSMPQEKDGAVFFGTKNGLIYALDAGNGSILWTHKVSNTIVNTVAPVDRRSVVVTDVDGNVIMLKHGN